MLEYHLYAADKNINAESISQVTKATGRINAKSKKRNADSSDWKLRQGFSRQVLSAANFRWSTEQPPLQARAMVLADKTLFIAGPPDVVDEQTSFYQPDDPGIRAKLSKQVDALDGQEGALLWVVSAADGQRRAQYQLESVPVWDGMAAANGRLCLAMKDGSVLCFAEDK